MILTDPNQVLIYGLIFLLGLVIGGFLFAGSGRKWKTLYRAEQERNAELERTYTAREKEWREQESLRAAALKNNPRTADPRDTDNDGVVEPNERRGGIMDRLTGRDRDRDGVRDANDGHVDRDGDGVDDRRER